MAAKYASEDDEAHERETLAITDEDMIAAVFHGLCEPSKSQFSCPSFRSFE